MTCWKMVPFQVKILHCGFCTFLCITAPFPLKYALYALVSVFVLPDSTYSTCLNEFGHFELAILVNCRNKKSKRFKNFYPLTRFCNNHMIKPQSRHPPLDSPLVVEVLVEPSARRNRPDHPPVAASW